jgi:hypothetical protein
MRGVNEPLLILRSESFLFQSHRMFSPDDGNSFVLEPCLNVVGVLRDTLWDVAGRIGVGLRQSEGGAEKFRAKITIKIEVAIEFAVEGCAASSGEEGRDRVSTCVEGRQRSTLSEFWATNSEQFARRHHPQPR